LQKSTYLNVLTISDLLSKKALNGLSSLSVRTQFQQPSPQPDQSVHSQFTVVSGPPPASPFAFDLGKGLQLIQSGLLLVTFFWALNERKRYRRADKYSELVVKFTAQTLDALYADIRNSIQDVDLSPTSRAARTQRRLQGLKAVVLSDSSIRLFHARTLILYRVSCFPPVELNAMETLFEEMEDNFAVAVDNLTSFDTHPQFVTVEIAKVSAKIMEILLARESALSGQKRK
jgi:hypothetical protein